MSFVSPFKYSKNYHVDKSHKKETISKSDYVFFLMINIKFLKEMISIQNEANVNVFLAFIMPNYVM